MNCVDELGVREVVINALKEDIGAGDITTDSLIPADKLIKACILAKEESVVCGLNIAKMSFKLRDKNIKFESLTRDGAFVKKDQKIAFISGKARGILAAERVALNFLAHLSGVSTQTRIFVNAARPYRVKILDTRKTTPGLRALEKYAVRIGGGFNHRFSLSEMVLIKDNHLNIIGGVGKLDLLDRRYRVEIEVKNLKELKQALTLEPDIIMLDNMSLSDMHKAVNIRNSYSLNPRNPAPKLEASGGITLKNIKEVSACGLDMISIGSLTHSVRAIDLSLEVI